LLVQHFFGFGAAIAARPQAIPGRPGQPGQPGAAASGFGVRGLIETGQPIGRPALVVLEDYKQRYTPAHVTGASEKKD